MSFIRFEFAGMVLFAPDQTFMSVARRYPNDNVMSAGYVTVGLDGKHRCYGEAMSVNGKAGPEDTQIIQDMMG